MGLKSQVIRAITIISNPLVIYEVGCTTKDGSVVYEIIDSSCEWENSIDFLYYIKDEDGELIATIENCPVLIEYNFFEETIEVPLLQFNPDEDLPF